MSHFHHNSGRQTAPDGPRGFTMIEVMVAISLLAGLTTVVWVTVNDMFRSRNIMTDRYERYQVMRVSMDRLNSEIASAYVAGHQHGAEQKYEEDEQQAGAGGQEGSDQDQQADQMAEAWREPVEFGMYGRDDELNFTSFAHTRMFRGERASHHAEIGYFVQSRRNADGDLVKSLMRREDTTIDDDITQGGKVYTLIPNIEEIEFEYWDPGEVELGDDQEEMAEGRWRDEWDTEDRQYYDRLPTRVRITVTLPPLSARGEPQVFSTQTEIMTHEMLEF